jgi:hypothetical protein
MTTEFEKNIKDPNLSAVIDLSYQGRPLLIAFGGMLGSVGVPPFEFFNLTKDLDVNKIYLRDLRGTWYHSGLPGISNNIDETAFFLKSKIDEAGIDKVVVFGNSMGGYAAIIFGILIKADIVHAFSPQTSIKNPDIIRHKKQIQNVHNNFPDTYFDLNEAIDLYDNLGEFNIYYDSKDKLDKKHARHFKNSQNITLHSFNGGGHRLIKTLRDSGELRNIVISSLNDEPNKAINAGTKKHHSFLAKLFGAGYDNH